MIDPCTKLFRSAHFYIDNINNLCYKTSYLNEEVNCTEPSSPSDSVPSKEQRYIACTRSFHMGFTSAEGLKLEYF
jgi:hypothetical protein